MPGIHSARYQADRAHKRADWKATQRPCALCGQAIDYDLPKDNPEHFQLDHIKSRRSHPELENDPNNWQPSHASCNKKKGQGPAVAELGETSEVW